MSVFGREAPRVPSSGVSWSGALLPARVFLPAWGPHLGQEGLGLRRGRGCPLHPDRPGRDPAEHRLRPASGPDGELVRAWGAGRVGARREKVGGSWGRDGVGGPRREGGDGPPPGAHDGAPAPPRARPLPGPGEETRRF